jgi:ferredoxin
MKVRVEAIECDGYAKCVRIAPSLFVMNSENVAEVLIPDELTDEQLKLAKIAATMCPSKAIHLTE